jgi:hypothetical protein
MGEGFVETGIDILSNLSWGTCLCHSYQTIEDLVDFVLPFFKKRQECREFCVWNALLSLSPKKVYYKTLQTRGNLNSSIRERNMVSNVSLYF